MSSQIRRPLSANAVSTRPSSAKPRSLRPQSAKLSISPYAATYHSPRPYSAPRKANEFKFIHPFTQCVAVQTRPVTIVPRRLVSRVHPPQEVNLAHGYFQRQSAAKLTQTDVTNLAQADLVDCCRTLQAELRRQLEGDTEKQLSVLQSEKRKLETDYMRVYEDYRSVKSKLTDLKRGKAELELQLEQTQLVNATLSKELIEAKAQPIAQELLTKIRREKLRLQSVANKLKSAVDQKRINNKEGELFPAVKEYLELHRRLYRDREKAVHFMEETEKRIAVLEAQPNEILERNRELEFQAKKLTHEVETLRHGIEEYFLSIAPDELDSVNPEFAAFVGSLTSVSTRAYPVHDENVSCLLLSLNADVGGTLVGCIFNC